MADICIIYASPNKDFVRKLEAALLPHWTVWWDDQIKVGDYRSEIENQIRDAKCVVPIWCRISRANQNVLDEADFAKQLDKPLVPVRLENVGPPIGFGALQRTDLFGWDGDPRDARVQTLIERIASVVQRRPQLLPRASSITISGHALPAPHFFYSVSSHETQLDPIQSINALKLFGADSILVSAYDLYRSRRPEGIKELLHDYQKSGRTVLLDSGNYEASRKADVDWTHEKLRQVLLETPHDFAFCFDDLKPPGDARSLVAGVIQAVRRDTVRRGHIALPIVHAPRNKDGTYITEIIPEIMRLVARDLRPPILAIPERELGAGVLERARTVFNIRQSLDTLGFYQPLHLLGTGNPLTIAIMSAAGADSFDGLEWCRFVTDHNSGALHHFQQYDFFSFQSQVVDSDVTREAALNPDVSYAAKVIFHNLSFFSEWIVELRRKVREKKIDRFLSEKLPRGVMPLLEQALPEVFDAG